MGRSRVYTSPANFRLPFCQVTVSYVSPQTAPPAPHSLPDPRSPCHWENWRNRTSTSFHCSFYPALICTPRFRLFPGDTGESALCSWLRSSPLLVHQTPAALGHPSSNRPYLSWPWDRKGQALHQSFLDTSPATCCSRSSDWWGWHVLNIWC